MGDLISVALGAFIGFLITGAILSTGYDTEMKEFRQAAIQRGYAEWVVIDEGAGKVEFRWKELVK